MHPEDQPNPLGPTGAVIEKAEYTVDSVGNRLSRETTAWHEDYGYDGTNQLTSAQVTGLGANAGKAYGFGYQYDAVGNRLGMQVTAPGSRCTPFPFGYRAPRTSTPGRQGRSV